ncbi:hypothetical protein [Parvibaculum sp.]|uniref:hypothetical protein n=1 Tax=Parvibaculum sp. TaxID=2024848 RepID=UPI0025D2EA20|nr:hypothetical protein [Parvibaculum sp.]
MRRVAAVASAAPAFKQSEIFDMNQLLPSPIFWAPLAAAGFIMGRHPANVNPSAGPETARRHNFL